MRIFGSYSFLNNHPSTQPQKSLLNKHHIVYGFPGRFPSQLPIPWAWNESCSRPPLVRTHPQHTLFVKVINFLWITNLFCPPLRCESWNHSAPSLPGGINARHPCRPAAALCPVPISQRSSYPLTSASGTSETRT